ncbi:MAG TPA: SUMF1/EgtB/PvdO family nonheme iron enzyme [Phototrophicaceae bacterium]|nr:SUMF1/EgtB/PvdO family nonheme iron enzyme [Phototrophicaceae bacterium]
MPPLFISYARKDALDLAQRLYADLTAAGYTVWQDVRDLDPARPFDSAIEKAIREAPAMIVLITPDVAREDSFVRREIAYALEVGTRLIPLKCSGGIMPVTINLLTWIAFADYEAGKAQLLERLPQPDTPAPMQTRREQERAYLQGLCQQFEQWLYLYTDLGGRAQAAKPKVAVKTHALKYVNMQNAVYREHGFLEGGDHDPVDTVNELREVVRQGGIVLIGEPGSGKTTTLQRLTYEFAVAALDDDHAPLPVYVPLGAYTGGGLEKHITTYFGGLALRDYPPKRVVLLLDGLNEMPRNSVPEVDDWLQLHRDMLVVVTCRKLDYTGLRVLPLRRVDVSPLDVSRIRLFIGNYLEDVDRDRLFWALVGEDLTQVWKLFQTAQLDFDDFWQGGDIAREPDKHPVYDQSNDRFDRIYNAMRAVMRETGDLPGLLGLVSNPFLLKITVEVFISSGQPPTNRGQLFAAFVDLLLERRGRLAVNSRDPQTREQARGRARTARQALAQLAYRMQSERLGTSVSVDWAKIALADNDFGSPDELLYLAESATLLTLDSAKGELKFFHQLLQEYFAACELGEDVRRGVPAAHFWPGDLWWQPTGWEETAVLLAGMQTGIADWLKETHPVLACRALTEGLADAAAAAPVQTALVAVMTGAVPPLARAEAGRILNRLGDPRPGVGLRSDGLPDMEWVEIPAGPFLMGCDKSLQADDKEAPPHEVTLPTYCISRYLVTNIQFQAFIMASDGYNRREWWTESGWAWKGERTAPDEYADLLFRLANHPRIYVRWYEALAFCRWLSVKLGYEVTLPTEAQWEKAARGTDGRIYPYGNEYDAIKANTQDTGIGQTSAVGLFSAGASPYGVLDMSGNVWEWCLSKWREFYVEPEDTDWEGSDARVLRGGSWFSADSTLFRAPNRYRYAPVSRSYVRGFRCVRL